MAHVCKQFIQCIFSVAYYLCSFDAEWSVSGSGIGDYGFPLLDNRLQTRKLSPGNLYSLVYDGQEAETYFNTMLLYAKPKSPNQMKPSKV